MSNALAREKSPYLLQHRDNPVAWMPWGEAAFARSRAEQKPIFLSIGYSTCHWCHVMAHESFENVAIADLLNEHFVSIKVDREERPDVDKVYMAYVQSMTGHGGWPLNIWLTPTLKPFYGGTYFPPEDRQGRAGFPSLLRAIARGWQDERDKLVAEGDRALSALREHFEESTAEAPAGESTELADAAGEGFEKGFAYFHDAFDARHGGFGGAPKFPRASNLTFLFRVAALQGKASEMSAEAIRLATTTLRAMARSGIHDHVGGGFHRYAVDEAWLVPHFEKMLYDQAQIAMNCLEAKQATGDERFAWLARDIFDYVLRDLTHANGGFYTAEDADSLMDSSKPGSAEGAFYVWSAAELRAVLGSEATVIVAHFGVEENGNVAAALDPQHEFQGKNILAQRGALAQTAVKLGITPAQASDQLVGALIRLRQARASRPRPQLDDKVISANNGLMISAFARGAQVLELGESAFTGASPGPYQQAALRAAEFVERELYDAQSGRLFRVWRQGRGASEGFADDYAFLVQGLLDLYETVFDLRWLQWAQRLQERMDVLFWDEARGGYFNSAADDTSIVLRLKEDYDGAEPAPSSVAAMNLLRLAGALQNEVWRQRGRLCLEAFRTQWSGSPHAMPQMLCALELALEPPRHVVLAGDPQSTAFRALAAVLFEALGPQRIVLAAAGGDGQRWLAARAPWLAAIQPQAGRATAYLCEAYTCQSPVSTPEELRRLLG